MNFDFLDIFGVVVDAVDLLTRSTSSSNIDYNKNAKQKKKTKYVKKKVSSVFILISSILLFIVFKDPLPAENYTQTLIVVSLMGLAVSLLFFFILHALEKYYFKSIFQWLFFSCSMILFFVSVVLCVYFKSGIFI